MSKSPLAPLTTLDPSALETAAGGRRAASGSSSRRAADTAILDALKDVEDSVRSMATAQSQNANHGNEMMMMALMMSKLGSNNAAPQPIVVCGRKRGC